MAMQAAEQKQGLVMVGVSFHRGSLAIVDDQSLHVPKGGGLALTGSNGVGKSTLLQLCAGLIPPDAGTILLHGERAFQPLPSTLIRRGIVRAVVFQQDGLVAQLSVLENVMLPLRYHADVLKLDEATIEERARHALAELGVRPPDIHAPPGRLSAGMRRRVAFARALAVEPDFVFFDDPDAGLDHDNADRIGELLLRYRDDPDVTLLVATNRRSLLEQLAVPIAELFDGRLSRPDLVTMPPRSLI